MKNFMEAQQEEMSKEFKESGRTYCACCLLAESMKDCPHCIFNYALEPKPEIVKEITEKTYRAYQGPVFVEITINNLDKDGEDAIELYQGFYRSYAPGIAGQIIFNDDTETDQKVIQEFLQLLESVGYRKIEA